MRDNSFYLECYGDSMNLNDDTFSDPNFGQEIADLNFDNLIGGPLGAVVSAQASSALET